MSLHFHTYGCKVNTFDTGVLEERLSDLKLADQEIHIINSCAVTQEAISTAVKQIRRLKGEKKSCIVVTGCGAQVDTKIFEDLKEVDLIVANSHKEDLATILRDHLMRPQSTRVFKANIFEEKSMAGGLGHQLQKTRAFLKVQDGCNQFCSYCIVPFARGKSRSLPLSEVISLTNEILSSGKNEVILTGVHLADYHDGRHDFEDLVEELLNQTSLPRLRLSSLEPQEISPRLLDLMKRDDRLCRHFHLSIQSGCNLILKSMRRKYKAEKIMETLGEIKSSFPEAYVGMDMITGFPGETQDSFETTYRLLADHPWTRLHVFPYSERQGTLATKLPSSVALSSRRSRAKILRQLSDERMKSEAIQEIGSIHKVLLLKGNSHGASGLSRTYWPVSIRGLDQKSRHFGQECEVRIDQVIPSPFGKGEPVLAGELL